MVRVGGEVKKYTKIVSKRILKEERKTAWRRYNAQRKWGHERKHSGKNRKIEKKEKKEKRRRGYK